jgi:hypothetical protein
MAKSNLDKTQAELTHAIENDAPCTFDEPIPVLVTLDNGVKYEGVAIRVEPADDIFPRGLVMVRAGNTDIGVPVNYIRAK